MNDLQGWVCTHFSWHSNSSPTRTELMSWSTKAWPGRITKIPEGLVRAWYKLNIALILILPNSVYLPIRRGWCLTTCWTWIDSEIFRESINESTNGRMCFRCFRCFRLSLSLWRRANARNVSFLRPRPHVSGYFWIRNFFFPDTAIVHTHTANSQASPEIFESAGSPEWKFLNPITFRIRVDGRIRIFSDTMTSQNWRQCLPRKFKLGRRSKVNSFSAPCAYFQSFSLYAAKMWLYYMLK